MRFLHFFKRLKTAFKHLTQELLRWPPSGDVDGRSSLPSSKVDQSSHKVIKEYIKDQSKHKQCKIKANANDMKIKFNRHSSLEEPDHFPAQTIFGRPDKGFDSERLVDRHEDQSKGRDSFHK